MIDLNWWAKMDAILKHAERQAEYEDASETLRILITEARDELYAVAGQLWDKAKDRRDGTTNT